MKIAEALRAKPRPALVAMLKFLDKLPADEVFSAAELTAKKAPVSLRHCATEGVLSPYRSKVGHRHFWGSKKAIEALNKQAAQ